MKRLQIFDTLKEIYEKNGFSLYMVGGATRDYCLGRPFDDFDFVTDALPVESLSFLKDANDSFARYGTLKVRIEGRLCDVATLREEGDYLDHRHPSSISFVKDPKIDSNRRDFTINALYLNKDYEILDFHNGLKDLDDKVIRFIGDPYLRIKEDPLRIARAERFATLLGFAIEEETQKAIDALYPLLNEISKGKLEEEKKKGWRERK